MSKHERDEDGFRYANRDERLRAIAALPNRPGRAECDPLDVRSQTLREVHDALYAIRHIMALHRSHHYGVELCMHEVQAKLHEAIKEHQLKEKQGWA
jgi:hypothetical protein